MCDLLSSEVEGQIIQTDDTYSKTKILCQGSNEDENAKDAAPEVVGKTDAVSKAVLEKLSSGLLSYYIEDITKTSSSLQELIQNQNIVIETLQQENARFSAVLKVHQLADMFSKLKLYYTKVQVLKKDMLVIIDRTAKLKKRAMKLQQQKQKEALQKELQRDREIERDKQLAPKIVTKSLSEK